VCYGCLIHYIFVSAVGCTNLIPPEDAWIKRDNYKIVIGCYTSRQTWQLRCHDGRWTGVVSNCSQGPGTITGSSYNKISCRNETAIYINQNDITNTQPPDIVKWQKSSIVHYKLKFLLFLPWT